MKTRYLTTILIAASSCLLGACGGGGTSVHPGASPTADPPQPPPPPSSASAEPCPAPVTANCAVDVPYAQTAEMTGGRQSEHALTLRGSGELVLTRQSRNVSGGAVVDFRFDGGTTVENGFLSVRDNANLRSDVLVQSAGHLGVGGSVTGNVTNHGAMGLLGSVIGDVINDGTLTPAASIYGTAVPVPVRIHGNFSQTSNGTLVAVIKPAGDGDEYVGGFISVTGRADIAGTLQLNAYTDDWGPYALAAAPFTMQVLHADGGVFGQFAKWTSPGLFITGAPRYLGNDVYFDATAISVASAMAAAKAGDALTLASATRFDAALDHATGATAPDAARTPEQQQLLATAGLIQRTQSFDQAVRTFDSLSGSGYTSAIEALLLQSSLPDASLMTRMDSLRPGSKLGAWSGQTSMLASGNGAFTGMHAGFDQWLGDRLALGVSLGTSEGSLKFGHQGGTARDRSPQWDVYVQQLVGDGGYVFGDIDYGRHQLDTQRAIDLGIGQFRVTGMRNLDLLRAHVESGQHFRIGNGRLTLFGALSHATLRGAGFVEQGGTGFELVAQPSSHQRTSATTGLRFGQIWHSGDHVTSLNLATGYSQVLLARDNALAAFTGTPAAAFALDALPAARSSGWLQLGLDTGNERWNLGLNYDRLAGNQSLVLHTRLAF